MRLPKGVVCLVCCCDDRLCDTVALSSVRGTPQHAAPVLTAELRQHCSHILQEYRDLQDKAALVTPNSEGREQQQLYQRISFLDPVVTLIQQLESKEQVCAEEVCVSSSCECVVLSRSWRS